ncbi:MAG: hypothetical protein O9327_04980 [Polaromonas sp.]|nr:hypothetical protein [Polaromonas sp.]
MNKSASLSGLATANSWIHRGAPVVFPEFTGERVYMAQFTLEGGLPPELARWQATVDAMLDGIDVRGPIFFMVDQGEVRASATHRRPGLHVDGRWNPATNGHEHSFEPPPERRRQRGPRAQGASEELLVLASDTLGCAAYVGEYTGLPDLGGDCSHIETRGLQRVELSPGRAWAGPALSMLHESIPVLQDCRRTVVRLNVQEAWIPRHH